MDGAGSTQHWVTGAGYSVEPAHHPKSGRHSKAPGDPFQISGTWAWDGADWSQLTAVRVPTWMLGAPIALGRAAGGEIWLAIPALTGTHPFARNRSVILLGAFTTSTVASIRAKVHTRVGWLTEAAGLTWSGRTAAAVWAGCLDGRGQFRPALSGRGVGE
jgi:hypothetical protein